jgi:hypothetical protein
MEPGLDRRESRNKRNLILRVIKSSISNTSVTFPELRGTFVATKLAWRSRAHFSAQLCDKLSAKFESTLSRTQAKLTYSSNRTEQESLRPTASNEDDVQHYQQCMNTM